MAKLNRFSRNLALMMIKLYQRYFSPDHSYRAARYPHGFCRFHPTCSQYSYEAIDKYGLAKGFWLSLKRIFRCHPFAKGGFDPLK